MDQSHLGVLLLGGGSVHCLVDSVHFHLQENGCPHSHRSSDEAAAGCSPSSLASCSERAAALWFTALPGVALSAALPSAAALAATPFDVCDDGGTADPGARFGNLRMVLCAADLDAPEPIVSVTVLRRAADEFRCAKLKWGVFWVRGRSRELAWN